MNVHCPGINSFSLVGYKYTNTKYLQALKSHQLSSFQILFPSPLPWHSEICNMPTGHLFQEIPWETTMEAYYHREGNGEREPMFEKPLTPSDVGKLNRLVIPKQHAEKYFPLAADSDKKGSLLSFQDEAGKLWWFRYSYWTSSQSYVLTKGWSRFVKEKQLDAGDVVLFERTTAEDRLFIRCRRRADTVQSPCTSSMQQEYLLQRGEQSVAVPKRLRLFGVNLECMPEQAEPETVHSAAWFIGHKHVQRGLNWSEE